MTDFSKVRILGKNLARNFTQKFGLYSPARLTILNNTQLLNNHGI